MSSLHKDDAILDNTPRTKKIVFRRGGKLPDPVSAHTSSPASPISPGTIASTAPSAETESKAAVAVGRSTPESTQQQQQQPPPSQRQTVDRMVFSSVHFSAPTFANNVTNRVLLPHLMPQQCARRAAADGPDAEPTADEAPVDYAAVANRLTLTLQSAIRDVARVQETEAETLQGHEVRCRRVEIREKRQLAAIRMGLEGTTARLHEYENRVCNALAATAGIEQHLAQSNARVLHGKSVSQLLRYFKMFTRMNPDELRAVLRNLGKARAEQRARVTAQWEAGNVSAFEPMYYGSAAKRRTDGTHVKINRRSGRKSREDNWEKETESDGSPVDNESAAGGAAGEAVARNDQEEEEAEKEDEEKEEEDDNANAEDEDEGEEEEEEEDGNKKGKEVADWQRQWQRQWRRRCGKGRVEKMHRLETAAVAMGLDRTFAVRSAMEAQVEWCQKLLRLRDELKGAAGSTGNVELYVEWLREEIVADAFHLIDCFNELYAARPETAAHQSYGRALLKTLELVSRLYATITPTHDALLGVFYSRSTNDMGIKLFSEYAPRPLPAQPPLATPGVQPGAMHYFTTVTLPDLKRTFDFIIARARRDVIIAETLFGTTNAVRQQLLAQITDVVVKPLLTQQLKLVELFQCEMIEAEGQLSPRSKRRAAPRVADAIAYAHNMQSSLFGLFQSYVTELRGIFDRVEVDFLSKYSTSIFTGRAAYAEGRAELELLQRYHTMLEEQYTRDLHPVPDEFFDLREAHMRKTKELIERFTEVTARVRTYALPKDAVGYTMDLIKASLDNMGKYLDAELRKTMESIRADRDNWRARVRSENDLLCPSTVESHQCGLRMLLFVQSSLMSLSDAIAVSFRPFVLSDARLSGSIEEAKESAFEALDERAEALLNLCTSAIIIRSLSILLHYQGKHDFMPKVPKGEEGETLAPPCTRACTLFCHYVSQQFEEAKEFIRLSNGQVPRRQTASPIYPHHSKGGNNNHYDTVHLRNNNNNNNGGNDGKCAVGQPADGYSVDAIEAVKARAQTMNLQQLLYGDGGPSSFVRTIGVCICRGIAAHLKTFTVNDRGALIYKQDVTAYWEAMGPIIRTPGLGGAVVDVLFRLLKETASLLLMPWDHIKGVRETGLLRLMSGEEKVQYIRMREDLRDGFRKIDASA